MILAQRCGDRGRAVVGCIVAVSPLQRLRSFYTIYLTASRS
jgi:hypothetical protein